MHRRSLLLFFAPITFSVAVAVGACIEGSPPGGAATSAGGSGAGGGGGGAGGSAGVGGTGGNLGGPEAGSAVCVLDNGTDPVGFCTQKLVLLGEHQAAFDPKHGVAQSWDSATLVPDVGAGNQILHDPRDDAAYAAASARYHQSATTYGDDEVTSVLDDDLLILGSFLMSELANPPAGYAGELYQDLRTASGGLRTLERNDLGDGVDMIAEGYGRAIFDTYFVPLGPGGGGGGGGAGGAGGVEDAVLGAPAAPDGGGGIAYAPADAATGALALIDLAVRHTSDDPVGSAKWQGAAAGVLAHLDARARDGATGLYFAALVTSADPGHDALAPASPSGPPADALLTEVNGRIALAFLRAQALATANPSALPDVAALPLEARAEALLAALDGTPQPLWDSAGGPSNDDGGTLGAGYFTGWVPSTAQLLTDKPTRANALVLAALHDAFEMGNGPDVSHIGALWMLLKDRTMANAGFMTLLDNQNGYFLASPPGFTFVGVDAGPSDPRQKSYFSSANTAAVEGLSELWLGMPQ